MDWQVRVYHLAISFTWPNSTWCFWE